MEKLYVMTLLLVLTTFSGAQLQSSVERPCPRESVTFTCTVSSVGHQWQVPSRVITEDLLPSSLGRVISSPPFQFAVTEVVPSTSITSTAIVNATEDLNGTLVLCRDGVGMEPEQNSTLNLRAPPVTSVAPSVTFPIPREQFTITWEEPPLRMNETIDAYFINISGPDDLCGNGNTLQRVTELNYTCTIQTTPQEGDTYTITVTAASCGGDLRGPESEPLHLQVPDAPLFTFQPGCPGLSFFDIVWQNTSVIMPAITEVCVNCTGDNCTYECRPVSGNNPFRVNNIVPGENYTVSLSLRNDFGQSGESDPELYVNSDEQCPTTTTSTTSTPPTQPPSTTPTPSLPTTLPPPDTSSNAGAIAGGVIGGLIGVIIIALIIIVIAYLIWKKKNSPKPKKSEDINLKTTKNADRNGHNPESMYQGLQSTEADTESVYDQLEKNKPAEELQEQGDPNNIVHETAPPGGVYAVTDTTQGLPYTEIGFTASGEAPQKEPGAFYSDDVQNV